MLVDETTIILEAEGAIGEYMRVCKSFFQNELKDGKALYTGTINAEKREELRKWHFDGINRYKQILYSNKQFYCTLFLSLSDEKVHIL